MKVGNKAYRSAEDLPDTVPVFPLSGALLLPGGQMPLNLFEPRYLAMFDAAIASDRIIGMVQPRFSGDRGAPDKPNLCDVGCLGRVTSFSETGDGRYIITLHGVARFRILEELSCAKPFRRCRIMPFEKDLHGEDTGENVDRDALLRTFKAYLDANELDADWDSVKKAGNETLVNALSMMSPYGPAEKQALLESPDLKSRADTLVAITEMSLVRDSDDFAGTLQ